MNLKGLYPWRLGVTSFVVPADIIANVRLMANKVDDIQLLFFESVTESRLAHPVDVSLLKRLATEHDITYSVHLPTDIRLGSADKAIRRQGIAEITRLVEQLGEIAPQCLDLHLQSEPNIPESEWLGFLDESLTLLAAGLGEIAKLVAVENTEDEPETVWQLAQEHGLGLCLDVGHLLLHGHKRQALLDKYLPAARHLHLHGVRAGKDHQAISHEQAVICRELAAALLEKGYQGVVTLELYAIEEVRQSLKVLKQTWKIHERRRER